MFWVNLRNVLGKSDHSTGSVLGESDQSTGSALGESDHRTGSVLVNLIIVQVMF